MPLGNRCGPGILRHFERVFVTQEVLNTELRGERRHFHISGQGGCLEVAIKEIEADHKDCEVKLRTLGVEEEALLLVNNFLRLLRPRTQEKLRDFFKGMPEGGFKAPQS